MLVLVTGLTLALAWLPANIDPLAEVRAEARAAVRALHEGDLATLDQHLAANRGQPDFAYFFTSKTTPRTLGDALATVAGTSADAPFRHGVDAHAYELALTDLAGTLALATHGAADRALPRSWTEDFVQATTWPEDLAGKSDAESDELTKQRADQDLANKQNLLLLLSRGYWSTGFLMKATAAYWDFDRDKGEAAWPGTVLDRVKYAPAPNGSFLTDGVLALTAALTANPVASRWAFTEFQPGTTTVEYDGDDHALGKFTHYLFFEHKFPESDDESVGMTATLTALSSAIGGIGTTVVEAASHTGGPMADSIVLQSLVKSMADDHGGSIFAKAWDFTKRVAPAVWHWVQHWGHRILDILSFAPPPFGTVAAGTIAVWYVIDGDYADAGLSLAAAIPGLAFVKIAKVARVAKGAKEATEVVKARKVTAGAAMALRAKPWKTCERVAGGLVVKYGKGWKRAQRRAADAKVKAIWEAARMGELRKTLALPSTTYKARFKAAGGKVPRDSDLDHTIDRQFGGSDDILNLKPLDRGVNRSLGTQFEKQLRALPFGTPIRSVAICGR